MVRLSKIYTKTGDDGTTGLGDGSRVAKDDVRVEAYGTVDEANAAIGVCVVEAGRAAAGAAHPRAEEMSRLLVSIQNELFDVGADLCCPVSDDERGATGGSVGGGAATRLRITGAETARLERAIDEHNERLRALDSFVLPGGTALASALHVARTVTRRAERVAVLLGRREGARVNAEVVRYLNRLNDLLFVLARVANDDGAADVKWRPGGTRGT